MEYETIDVIIARDGTVKIKVEGVTGNKCLVLTERVEAALGGEILSREMTADAYETVHQEDNSNVYG